MTDIRLASLIESADSPTLSAALVVVDGMPTTPASVGVRAALIGALERLHPEAAKAVAVAFELAELKALETGGEAERVDYVAVLLAALPPSARPKAKLGAAAVRLNSALNGGNGALTDDERAMLRLEAEASSSDMAPGAKLERIRALGFTELAYYQTLNALIDTERALAAAAPLVNILRRQRAGGRRARAVA